MLELVAVQRQYGAGAVRIDGELRLVRPPHTGPTFVRLSEGELVRALADLGFTEEHRTFAGFNDLITWLREQSGATLGEAGRREANEATERMLHRADASTLHRHLDRVEQQLLAAARFVEASSMLTRIQRLPRAGEDADLRNRIASLQERVIEGLTQGRQELSKLGQAEQARQSWLQPISTPQSRKAIEALHSKVRRKGAFLQPGGMGH